MSSIVAPTDQMAAVWDAAVMMAKGPVGIHDVLAKSKELGVLPGFLLKRIDSIKVEARKKQEAKERGAL